MAEQMDKSKLSASRQIESSDEVENDKQDQYLRMNVIDVFGKEIEPICDYAQVNVNVNIQVTALLERTFHYMLMLDWLQHPS